VAATTAYTFNVTIDNPVDVAVTLQADTANGTALAGSDYTSVVASSVAFATGSTTTQQVTVQVNADNLVELNEAFSLILSSLGASGRSVTLGTATGTGTIQNDDLSTITNRFVFYGSSSFSSSSVAAAIDPSKQLASESSVAQTLSFSNLINTTRGINGLVFDFAEININELTSNDLIFQMSPQGAFVEASNPPTGWATAPAPTGIVITTSGTSSRVTISWPNNVIENRWLRISVLANSNTGLPSAKVFYLGHLRGEATGAQSGQFIVNNSDAVAIATRVSGTNVPVTNIYDLDKNGRVLNSDIGAMSSGIGVLRLRNIAIPASASGMFGSGSVRDSRPSDDVKSPKDGAFGKIEVESQIVPLNAHDQFFVDFSSHDSFSFEDSFETNRRRRRF
jgi:hypothetical protein